MIPPVAAFEEACAVCPPRRLRFRVGDIDVLVRVAGLHLADRIFSPLRHVAVDDDAQKPAQIAIDAWSCAETGVASPPQWPLEWCDFDARRIVCSFAGVDELPRLALARPFQRVLVPLLAEMGYPAIHGGLIAPPDDGPGLLLLGPNGCGKSTTCLSAVFAGFRLVGEDCLVVRRDGNAFVGHSLYRTCCLTAQSRSMLPVLPGPVLFPPGATPEDKGVLVLPHDATEPGPMRPTLPIAAVVFPVVTHIGSDSRFLSISAAEAYRRFLPGLRLMRLIPPERRQAHHDALSALVVGLPCYRLELGSTLQAIPDALRRLAAEVA